MNRPRAALLRSPLLQSLLLTRRRDVPVRVALRNTAAVALPLMLGTWSGHLAAGLAVSAGALDTMFADQPGPYRVRLQRMLLTALAAGVSAWTGFVLGGHDALMVLIAALWGFVGALLVALGPNAARAGMISMILLVITAAGPLSPAQALPAALLIFAGGTLQTLFAVAAWPLQRYRPERLALAQVFADLAVLARQAPGSRLAPPLTEALNEIQTLLHGVHEGRSRALDTFRVLAAIAERIRAELLALADLHEAEAGAGRRDAQRALLDNAAAVLDGISAALMQGEPAQAAQAAMPAFDAALAHLEEVCGDYLHDLARPRAAGLAGQLRAATRNAGFAGSRGEMRAAEAEARLPQALRPGNPLATLRANLTLDSVACRHAVRCGVCLALAVAADRGLDMSHGYWMPMTLAIVLKPDFGATWRFGLLRVIGTLLGLVLTTALLHFAPGGVWTGIALLAALSFAFRELATVHYGIAVACLTGAVVVLLAFYGVAPGEAMHARALHTALGSGLALLAYLLWPTWERGRERAALAAMLDAYRAYFDAIAGGDERARHEARAAARRARGNAEASLERLRHEPASARLVERADAAIANANRLVRAAMALEAAREDAGASALPEAATPFMREASARLAELAAALREARAPTADPGLRARQRALVLALDAAPSTPLSAALRDASDRIADSLGTLAHLLASARAASPPA